MEAQSTPKSSSCKHSAMVENMSRVHELMSQLRAVVLASAPAGRSTELVTDLFEDIFAAFNVVLCNLQSFSHVYGADPDERNGHKKRFGYF